MHPAPDAATDASVNGAREMLASQRWAFAALSDTFTDRVRIAFNHLNEVQEGQSVRQENGKRTDS